MDEILAVALRSMQLDMARLDQVAMNLANVSTAGYKRGVVVNSGALHTPRFAQALEAAATGSAALPSQPVAPLHGTDWRAGTLKATGQSLDLAISGDAYFEVATENGPAYTRAGSFQTDARGRIVSAQGHALMADGGEILLKSARPTISATGVVTEPDGQGDVSLGKIRLVRFPEGTRLEPMGQGLYVPAGGARPVAAEDAQVRQGVLENSNVNPAHEMTQLMQAMRHFESMQRTVQMRDDMLGTAIRRLGETQ